MKIKVDDELQALIPPLSTEAFEALKADIERHGVQVPISVDENGVVLDGHHRFKIAGQKCPARMVENLSPGEKRAYVIRSAVARRNLSPEQRKELLKLQKKEAASLREAGRTQAEVAALLGVSQRTVGYWEEDISISSASITYTPPDCRLKVTEPVVDLILSRVESGDSQVQVAADVGISQPRVSQIVKKATKKKVAKKQLDEAAAKAPNVGILQGDFRELTKVLPDGCTPLIFTDPPYDRTSVDLYDGLGEMAARILCDGGSLITYCGQHLVDEVMRRLTPHLKYFWSIGLYHEESVQRMNPIGIRTKWKPIYWFIKGGVRRDTATFVDDVIISPKEKSANGSEAAWHDWQQSSGECRYLIEKLTKPGELVVDPFCGGGTTAVVAEALNRRWWTCDVDEKSVKRASKRLSEAM